MELHEWLSAADVDSLEEAKNFLAHIPPQLGECRYMVELWTDFYKCADVRRLRAMAIPSSLFRGQLYTVARFVRERKNDGKTCPMPKAWITSADPRHPRRHDITESLTRVSGAFGSHEPSTLSLAGEPDCPLIPGTLAEIELSAGMHWLWVVQPHVVIYHNMKKTQQGLWYALASGTMLRFGRALVIFQSEVPNQLTLAL